MSTDPTFHSVFPVPDDQEDSRNGSAASSVSGRLGMRSTGDRSSWVGSVPRQNDAGARRRDFRIPFATIHSTTFRFLEAGLDGLALVLAWWLTIGLRQWLNPIMSIQFTPSELRALAPPISGVLCIWAIASQWFKLYRKEATISIGSHLLRALESVSVVSSIVIVVAFFSKQFGLEQSRSIVLLYAPVSLATLLMARYIALLTAEQLSGHTFLQDRVAIAGRISEATNMAQCVRDRKDAGLSIVGIVLPESTSESERFESENHTGEVEILGTTARLAELINTKRISRIIIAGGLTERERLECTRVSGRMGVIASHAIGYPLADVRMQLTFLYGLPLLEIRPVRYTKIEQGIKRIVEAILTAFLILLLSPLLALIAVLIKATSSGPAFYTSIRVGKGSRYFRFIKFRSMYWQGTDRRHVSAKNEKTGHIFKIRNDPRVTPLGRFLRRYSLDELPQLFNVLMGDMSLIGPRPLPAEDLDPDGMSRQFYAWTAMRSEVPPGITGLWQVMGRSNLDFEEMVRLDMEYLQNWSLALDLRILLETPLAVLTGRGAC